MASSPIALNCCLTEPNPPAADSIPLIPLVTDWVSTSAIAFSKFFVSSVALFNPLTAFLLRDILFKKVINALSTDFISFSASFNPKE